MPTTGQCSFNPDLAELPQSGHDLNGNGIDDAIDIMSGNSTDLDGDGVPDEAQACVAPQLTATPESQIVQEGDSVTLAGDALGTAPLVYQWNHNGQPISGANSNVLALENITPADLGDYTLTITNACGAITTVAATLSTEPVAAPVILRVQFVGGGFQLAFGTKVDLTYIVEFKNSLTEPSWAALETVVGDGQEQIVSDLGPLPTTRFYRVRTTAP